MRLLITVPWPERLGGAETMLWNFLRHVDPLRTEATVVFYEEGPFRQEVDALPGVETEVVPVGRLRQLPRAVRATRRLAETISARDPDVVLSWAAKAQIYAANAARMAGYGDRIVWWQHAIPSGHRMERMATLLPARAVGCSSTPAAEAQARMWPRRDVFVVHPGIEPERVEPVSLGDWGIPEGRIVVGIVGRLQPWKGQHRFLRALASLRRRGHDVHGLIVGGDAHGLSPEYGPYLNSLILELGLSGAVTMTGHVDDPRPYVAAMDLLVNASVAEPFGIVMIEGLSQSVPVIAARDGGARDIIEDGVSGVLVERPEPALLESAVEGLLANPARRDRLGRAGRERFLERFTAPAMAEQLQARLEAIGGHEALEGVLAAA
jgi:glycosyltransferase involved in cell wall biosynthesis